MKVGHDTVTPGTAFLAVNDAPPADAPAAVHLEHGRVTVVDSTNRTLLDISDFTDGAIANVLTAGGHAGLWIKSLSASGELPAPLEFRLDRGDVAFIDRTGVALALSTRRDTLVKIAYPDRVSWMTIAERFRLWIVGGVWLIATLALLLILQRMWRRRTAATGD